MVGNNQNQQFRCTISRSCKVCTRANATVGLLQWIHRTAQNVPFRRLVRCNRNPRTQEDSCKCWVQCIGLHSHSVVRSAECDSLAPSNPTDKCKYLERCSCLRCRTSWNKLEWYNWRRTSQESNCMCQVRYTGRCSRSSAHRGPRYSPLQSIPGCRHIDSVRHKAAWAHTAHHMSAYCNPLPENRQGTDKHHCQRIGLHSHMERSRQRSRP